MINGRDVSVWQGAINFEKMKATGVDFVFIKSTQGNYWDGRYKDNWTASKGILPRGPYHFYDFRYSLQANIDALVNAWTMYPGCELPPVLDWESTISVPTQSTAAGMCLSFLREVENRTGKTPMLYTSPGYWAAHGGTNAEFAHFPLWIAHYNVNTPSIPKPWNTWTFWQYSSKGDGAASGVSSAAIDLNYGNFANVDEFKVWAGILVPPPPAPSIEERLAACEGKLAEHERRIQALESMYHIYLPVINK